MPPPGLATTAAATVSPRPSVAGTPTTNACITSGCDSMASSTSRGATLVPPALITVPSRPLKYR